MEVQQQGGLARVRLGVLRHRRRAGAESVLMRSLDTCSGFRCRCSPELGTFDECKKFTGKVQEISLFYSC